MDTIFIIIYRHHKKYDDPWAVFNSVFLMAGLLSVTLVDLALFTGLQRRWQLKGALVPFMVFLLILLLLWKRYSDSTRIERIQDRWRPRPIKFRRKMFVAMFIYVWILLLGTMFAMKFR